MGNLDPDAIVELIGSVSNSKAEGKEVIRGILAEQHDKIVNNNLLPKELIDGYTERFDLYFRYLTKKSQLQCVYEVLVAATNECEECVEITKDIGSMSILTLMMFWTSLAAKRIDLLG